MVRDLARYEALEHRVFIDVATLRQALSKPGPRLEGHIAENDGKAVGFTSFYETFSTFAGQPKLYLEDIFVCESLRGTGVGHRLFDAYLNEARQRHCVRAEWQVLDWNHSAQDFYQSRRAKPVKDWICYGIDL